MDDEAVTARSGFEMAAVYGPEHLAEHDPARDVGEPGQPPFTRGIHPLMYRERPWTIRQYAGMSSAAASNRRYRYLLEQGTTGLSVAFDLPTQMGLDSDHPLAAGEVGRVGVAIDTVDDVRALFAGIPLDQVSTSMTINAPAAVLLLMYELAAEDQGVAPSELRGTIQNDVLKEYIARGTYIFPPEPSLRLAAETIGYCRQRLPRFNPISVSGYHLAEAGATPSQEIAFTLADAIAYLAACRDAGLDVTEVAAGMSFFLVARTNLLEEVAKFRAARRLWARLLVERFDIHDDQARRFRFHTQTAGVELTAQQPELNLVRVTLQALAATLGGTQSLHTNAYDEALSIPSQHAAALALRTQQVLRHETDLTATVDPFAGSYAIETMTDEIERAARTELARIDGCGGAVAAIEAGHQQRAIEQAAYEAARALDRGERTVVGVNAYREDEGREPDLEQPDPAAAETQQVRLAAVRRERDGQRVEAALADLRGAAAEGRAMLPPMREALAASASVQEVCDVLRSVFGRYQPPAV